MNPTAAVLLMYGGIAMIPIGAVVYAIFRRNKINKEIQQSRLFDLELSKRGAGWIKIQPLDAVYVSDVVSYDEKERVLFMKDGTKKKVDKVWALTMEREILFARRMIQKRVNET
ncbi:hypothetical protein PMSD_05025 [Paenibacillus macquariensis subsp. defensor]|nr:hypothetical protein PMSD_05025 [Paenibacillus macquariensis subsp. defensor]